MRRIIAISNNFPTPFFPEKGVFVMNALHEMSLQENTSVDVVAPYSFISKMKAPKRKKDAASLFPPKLNVIQPSFFSLPLRLPVNVRQLVALNDYFFCKQVESHIPAKDYNFAYAHFFNSGVGMLTYFERKKIPFFVNLGESDLYLYDNLYGSDRWISDLNRFSGIITVSRYNYDYLLKRDPSLAEKLCYIPNGVNARLFRPMDKATCRRQLGLPENEKIVAFCGHFDTRKGPLRVLEACKQLNVKGIFLGSNGPDQPTGDSVLHAGPVVNTDLPVWLNAADVFCLPSLSEGMSNAILEAMSCGLPLVVSRKPFNTDFIPEGSAIFADPESIQEITAGIGKVLSDTSIAEQYSQASLVLAETLSLQKRIQRIFSFVDKINGRQVSKT